MKRLLVLVSLIAALMAVTAAQASACTPGHSYQDTVSCRGVQGGLMVVTYTCVAHGGWYTPTNWYVVWGCQY